VCLRTMLAFVFLIGALAPGRSLAEPPPVSTGGIQWARNYVQAQKTALQLHRLLIVDMETDWCSWCRIMDGDVYPAPIVVRSLRQGYVFLRVNAESNPDGVALQRKFRVTGYPANIVVDPRDGLYIAIYGYRDVQQFLRDVKIATAELRQFGRLTTRVLAGTATTTERDELAQAFADSGLYDKAAKEYLELLEDPAVKLSPEEQFRAAVSLASAGDNQRALATIGALERDFPASEAAPEAEALEGEILWHEGNAARATRVLKQWLAKYPNNALAEHVRSILSQAR